MLVLIHERGASGETCSIVFGWRVIQICSNINVFMAKKLVDTLPKKRLDRYME